MLCETSTRNTTDMPRRAGRNHRPREGQDEGRQQQRTHAAPASRAAARLKFVRLKRSATQTSGTTSRAATARREPSSVMHISHRDPALPRPPLRASRARTRSRPPTSTTATRRRRTPRRRGAAPVSDERCQIRHFRIADVHADDSARSGRPRPGTGRAPPVAPRRVARADHRHRLAIRRHHARGARGQPDGPRSPQHAVRWPRRATRSRCPRARGSRARPRGSSPRAQTTTRRCGDRRRSTHGDEGVPLFGRRDRARVPSPR